MVTALPDDPVRTLATDDPNLRLAVFGEAGLVTYLIDDARNIVTLTDVTWAG